MRHRIACVFAPPRSGSNLLCEQLASAMARVSGKPVANLYEFLSPHQHVTNDGVCHLVDRHDRMARPDPMGIDILRLRRLDAMRDRIAVVKILTRDLHRGNLAEIDRLLDADHAYTICLNRADVANQILSYFISRATGLWHSNQGSASAMNGTMLVSHADMAAIGEEIRLHYLWHAEMAGRVDRVVWYDQLLHATYPELLGHGDPLPASQSKLNEDHRGRALSLISNADELIGFASDIEDSIASLRDGML